MFYLYTHQPLHCTYHANVPIPIYLPLTHTFSCFSVEVSNALSSSPEESRSCEGTGEEGAVEGEKGGEAAEKGRRGGGGRRGECPACDGSSGKWLPSSRPAGTGKDEREVAEEDLLQEEQNGQCVRLHSFSYRQFSEKKGE